MVLSPRIHILLYGGLLVWGLIDRVSAAAANGSMPRIVLGLLYLGIAGYQLLRGRNARTPATAVQRVRTIAFDTRDRRQV
jgi:hypothetical protein